MPHLLQLTNAAGLRGQAHVVRLLELREHMRI